MILMSERESLEMQDLLKLSDGLMHWAYHLLVLEECQLPVDFWLQYNKKQQAIGIYASLLLWVQSGCEDLPRVFQVKATIAIMSGQDSLIDVGTGAGKTLCMILPCLLAPTSVAVIFLPLKHLQVVQVLTFSRYQIKAIAINEDTLDNVELWKVCTLVLFISDNGNMLGALRQVYTHIQTVTGLTKACLLTLSFPRSPSRKSWARTRMGPGIAVTILKESST